MEVATESVNGLIWENLIIGKVIVTQETKTWLAHTEAVRDLPSLKKESEVVSTVIRMMHFSDLACIICQVVVNDERDLIVACEESENLAIVVKELLFRGHSATTQ